MELIQLNHNMKIVGEYPPLSIILSYIVWENVIVDSTIKHSVDHKLFDITRATTHIRTVVGLSLLYFSNSLLCFWALLQNFPYYASIMLHCSRLFSIRTWITDCLIRIYDCSIRVSRSFNFSSRAQLRFGGPMLTLGYNTEKQTYCLKALLSSEICCFIIYLLCPHYAQSLPIMPALCFMFWHAYYASN